MKNNRILKVTTGLALGLALLAPTTKEVYATSSSSLLITQTPQQQFEEKLLLAQKRYDELVEVKKQPAYFNASSALTRDFDLYLSNLGTELRYQKANKVNYKNDTQYNSAIYSLNTALSDLEIRYNRLDGRLTDRDDLVKLTTEEFTFKASPEYIAAPYALQKAYSDALALGNTAVGKGASLNNVEKEAAITAITNAKSNIIKSYQKKDLRLQLTAEITDANKLALEKDKYTKESYELYNTAKIAATTTLENQESTYEQIESSLNALKSAKANLKKIPTADDEKRQKQIADLRKAIEDNQRMVAAGEYLLTYTPKTVSGVKDKLTDLIKKSETLVTNAKLVLAQLENVKG